MKMYLLLGTADSESFNNALLLAYAEKAVKNGHQVRIQKLGDMDFDPILHFGYKRIQELEPDLQKAQENILWCDKWVIFYPIWWGGIPALLKGFLDRALTPGFGYKYRENSPWWDSYLKGRSAQIITTSDAPAFWIWWQYNNSDKAMMEKAVLKFCGFAPVDTYRIDRMRFKNRDQLTGEIKKMVEKLVP